MSEQSVSAMMSFVSRMAQILQNVLISELGGLLIKSVYVQEATRIAVIHMQKRHESACLQPGPITYMAAPQRREQLSCWLISTTDSTCRAKEKREREKRDKKNLALSKRINLESRKAAKSLKLSSRHEPITTSHF